MAVTVGTFNLNNLFSRFNFQAQVENIPQSGGGLTFEYSSQASGNPLSFQVRTFMGQLVKGKDVADTQEIADRIKAMNVDVLAVQEVEHIEILKAFNRDFLDGMYSEVVLVEANDQRLIDVGVLSKLPLGAITSFQTAVHPDAPYKRVFSRDLIRVEVLNPQRKKKLFSLYNTHLKSAFVPFYEDQVLGQQAANTRRQQQAEMISELISAVERPNSAFILTGDMNDTPDSLCLQPMYIADGLPLFNALTNPQETRPAKNETQGPGPQTTAWTYRRNPPGPQPPEFHLIDQIWLSASLKDKWLSAHIDRRTKHGGDGSDHDPAWVELDL